MELALLLEEINSIDTPDGSTNELLKKLGDFLREDSVRSSPEAKDSIPAVIKIANVELSQIVKAVDGTHNDSLILEALRVLINFLANNDDNRQFLASSDLDYKATFWSLICKLFSMDTFKANTNTIYERILLMLSQFIHNTNLLKGFIIFFSETGIGKCLLGYLRFRIDSSLAAETGFDELVIPTEIYSELMSEMSDTTSTDTMFANDCKEYLDTIIRVFKFAIRLNIDEDDEDEMDTVNEVFSNLSNIVYNITLCEDIPHLSSTEMHSNILKLIPQLPTKMQNFTLNKRRLFSSSGNIASMTNYDNSVDVSMALEYFRDPETDPYILSACAIDLGNYITSVEKSEWLRVKIDSEIGLKDFIENFYKIKFNDVIQYQAFHLFNNLMSTDIAVGSFDSYDSLLKSSKVVVDNGQYYKEVFGIYAKFMKKLILFAFIEEKGSHLSLFQFNELWILFNPVDHPGAAFEEVYLILTQAFIATKLLETGSLEHKNVPFVTSLVENLVSAKGLAADVPSTFLLEKLKTLGIFFKTLATHSISSHVMTTVLYDSDPDKYHLHFITPYHTFLENLQQILEEQNNLNNANNPNQFSVIQNNSKFVCATTIAYCNLSHETNEEVDAIQSICQSIIR